MKKNYPLEMRTTKELKKIMTRYGLQVNSSMSKEEMIEAINAYKASKKAELDNARDEARFELGRDFDRALMFWKRTHKELKYFTTEEYDKLTNGWKLLMSILGLIDEDKKYVNMTDDIKFIATEVAFIFNRDTDTSAWTEDECASYIVNTIEDFKNAVFSERITKEQYDLTKISITDVEYNGGKFSFNENRLYNPVLTTQVPQYGIPLLATSEDGISRILKENGVDTISVEMGSIPSNRLKLNSEEYIAELLLRAREDGFEINDEWIIGARNIGPHLLESLQGLLAELRNKGYEDLALLLEYGEIHKHKMLTYGFYLNSGKHYMPAFQSPSANRQATICFVLTSGKTIEECREQIQNMWLNVTGISTWNEFLTEFCDENGEVVMAKVVARIATRGSNSFSLDKIAPEIAKIVRNFNVYYAQDTETLVHKVYKTKVDNGLSEIMEKDVPIKDGDGQGLVSFTGAAYIAKGLKRISQNDLDYFLEEFPKIGKDASKVKPNSKLDNIIKRIPAVFQIRHGEKKGLLVRWNLEAIKATKGYDVIIPDSVRKFIGGEWSEYPLEICNFLKDKGDWAYLNPQFISALMWENPNALVDVCRYWEKQQLESIYDMAKAQHFHGIIKSSDDEENATNAGYLSSVLRNCSDLIDDFQVINWRKEQYRKTNDDMKIGRVMVPGQYTYMVFDPAYQINKWFGLDLPCLQSGEFYHNGKDCEAMMARSPLIATYEAQRVQLVNNENYKYLANTVVFNGFDGTADDMGGGDFDGDICEIVCNDSELGKIIVDGVRKCEYKIWSEAKSARKVPFTWENLIHYWATDGSTIDRTGVITNYASRALDIANHLYACIYFAKLMKCEDITFVHPRSFGKGLGSNVQAYAGVENGKRTWVVKGLAKCQLTKKAKESGKYDKDFKPEDVEPWDVWFPCDYGKDDTAILGHKSFEEVEEYIKYFLDIVNILRCDQGDEIDGAKTGFHPVILEFCKVVLTANHMLSRQEVLDKGESVSSKLNVYQSLSPLGRVHDYSVMVAQKVEEAFKVKGSNKIFLLQSLLTEEETAMLNMSVRRAGDTKDIKLIDYVADRKKKYNQKLHNAFQQGIDINSSIKDNEIYGTLLADGKTRANDGLLADIEALGITAKVMAAACYIATYTKDDKQGQGLSYGWILFDDLLSVFSRGNKKFELFKLPANVEKAYIKDEVLYINDNKFKTIKAKDCDMIPIQVINGRNYALIHKIPEVVVKARHNDVVYGAKTYTIGTYGFKYNKAGTKDGWKALVRENGYTFDITMDETNRAVMSINGESISALMPVGADFDLMNKKVRIVNNQQVSPIEEHDASIKNIQVIIIGEIQ